MSKAQNINPLFHRIYSGYFKTVRKIINSAVKYDKANPENKSISGKGIRNIITDESIYSKYQDLLDDNYSDNPDNRAEEIINTRYNEIHGKLYKLWHLFKKDESGNYTTTLSNVTRPQTSLEKRWLRTISEDPRFKLFVSVAEEKKLCQSLQEYTPLYNADTVVCFDQFTDGDDYSSQLYQSNFYTVLNALKKHRYLSFDYLANKDNRLYTVENVIPLRIEYSPKNDKFRLLAVTNGSYGIYNMSNIKDNCKSVYPIPAKELMEARKLKPNKLTAVIEIYDSRNALQRALIAFSDYEKEVEFARKDKSSCIFQREAVQKKRTISQAKSLIVYKMTITYYKTDEIELLIRILGMGHLVKVVESDSLIAKIRQRLKTQAGLLANKKAQTTNKAVEQKIVTGVM